MKNNGNRKKFDLLRTASLMLLAASFGLSACTKKKTPEIADEKLAEKIFSVSELQNAAFTIDTGAAENSAEDLRSASTTQEKPRVQIKKVDSQPRLAKLFRDLRMSGSPDSNYQVLVQLDQKNVNFFKIHSDDAELTTLEKQIAIRSQDGKSLKVLFMQTAVEAYGRLEREKDANKQQTSNLVLNPTAFQDATHVQISLNPDNSCTVGQCYGTRKTLEEVFLKDRVLNQVKQLSDLQADLNLALTNYQDGPVVALASNTNAKRSNIHIYRIKSRSQITDSVLLDKLKDPRNTEIMACSAEVKKQIDASLHESCVMELAYLLEATHVQAKLKNTDDFGLPTTSLEFEEVPGSSGASLLKVTKNSTPTLVGLERLRSFPRESTLKVSDLKGKEFLLRRTFEDGSATLMTLAAGSSGPLDIVRFEMEENRLVVRRADSVNGDKKPNQMDLEELMSLPVQYIRRDPHSDPLSPSYVPATPQTAEFISVNWLKNEVSAMNSPLLWYGSNECFRSVANQEISNADVRLEQGILNFSVKSSYSFTPSCMSFYGLNDYFWDNGVQGNFNLVERISFKLHTQELDNNPGPQVPFRVQNLLGYGVFTMGKLAPGETGNIGLVENEKSFPIIHDFSNGKVLTYHLGGLSDDWTREILIEGTKQVIQEWNASLRMSLKGTSLERSGDYIVLKIDGIDAEPGRLGDLDRNYIWNFAKALDSGPLGMAQPGPNPRSGRVEHNNVLMYSGNLLSQLGYLREIAKLQQQHEALKEQVLTAHLENIKTEGMVPADPEGAILNEDDGSEEPASSENLEQASGKLNALAQKALRGALRPQFEKASLQKVRSTPRVSVGPQLTAQLRRQGLITDSGFRLNDRKERVLRTEAESAFLSRIMTAAFKAAPGRTQSQLDAITAAEVLKAFGNRLNEREKRALAQEATLAILKAEFEKNFTAGPNCVKMGSITFHSSGRFLESSLQESFKKHYLKTLSHEIGHALGLTHNFIASTDKANFAFAGETKNESSRNYSSVMDYLMVDQANYQGPGPYDVRAIRAAYTGLLELDKTNVKEVTPSNSGLKVKFSVGGRDVEVITNQNLEMSIDQIRAKTVGNDSLWKLDSSMVQTLPLKTYKYCNDYQAGLLPLCTRWDTGTNPREVMESYIKDYKNLYVWRNNTGNRLNGSSFSRYLSSVIEDLTQMRLFLDEFIYKAIEGSEDEANEYALAAITARNALLEIVSTPNTNLEYGNPKRFQIVESELPMLTVNDKGELVAVPGPDGKPKMETRYFVVESKNTKDLFDNKDMRMKTRGIEYDKALALMMLTERRIDHPRYRSQGISIAFPDLDRMVDGPGVEDSETLKLLKGSLTDTIGAQIPFNIHPNVPYTFLLSLGATFEVPNTDLIRYYAMLGSNILLDTDSPEDKFNSASLFRVLNSKSLVPGRLMVTKMDQDMTSPASVKLFAMDNATIADQMVRLAAAFRVYVGAQAQMAPIVRKTLTAAIGNNQADVGAGVRELAALLQSLNKDKALFSEQDVTNGRNAGTIAIEIMQNSLEVFGLAAAIEEEILKGTKAEDIAELSRGARADFAKKAKENASFAAAHLALAAAYPAGTKEAPVEGKMREALSFLIDGDIAAAQYSYLINQLGAMNRFFYMMYPEQN